MPGKRIIKPSRWPYFDYTKLPYSLAVEKDGLLFISGQTAEREDPATGKMVCQGSLDEQTLVMMEKQKALIDAAGARPEHLVNRTIFRAAAGAPAINNGPFFNPAPPGEPPSWEKYFGKNYAPGTGLFMQGNLNLGAFISSDLTLDMRPGEKRYINPGFPPSPRRRYSSTNGGPTGPGSRRTTSSGPRARRPGTSIRTGLPGVLRPWWSRPGSCTRNSRKSCLMAASPWTTLS